jgi:hypothetical protein
MPFRISFLVALLVAGTALGTAVSGGLIAAAPAGPQPPFPAVKYYDPLP